ncbi:hypothetical protein H7H48_06305 [Nitratireductor sp. B36]|nr:hypothetical protein [Nitratireductor sp. B36]MCC5778654.1 hypothetical protein [Nitratireductor sp. B36]
MRVAWRGHGDLPVKKGALLTYANVAPDAASRLVALRSRQDAMVFGEG